jgi:zinc-binding alcohol dehydrogenase family protein
MNTPTMRVIGFSQFGSPDVLGEHVLPVPAAGPLDLLVRVKAASLNPVDTKLRNGAGTSGSTAPTVVENPPMVLGFDACGVVEAMGEGVRGFAVGDRVWYAGVTGRQGSYAQVQAVDHRNAAKAPANLSDADAATFPLVTLTAWESLFEQMGAGRATGAHLLVTGGAGGVGSIAVPLASKVMGLHVTATASRPESRQWCLDRGAHQVIDHARPLKEQMELAPDFILHTGSDTMVPELIDLVAPLGRICVIAGGPTLASLNVLPLIGKRAGIVFELMFTRARLGLEPEKQGQILAQMADLAESGLIPSPRARTIAWGDVAEGHRMLESRRTIGKIAMEVP